VRFLPLLFALTLSLYAVPKEINSFNGKFVQTIIDDNGKKIIYNGELWASKPQNALWMYQKHSATVKGQTYTVMFKNDILNSISYTDGFENRVSIYFINPAQNKAIEANRFKPIIPEDFDVIKDR